MKLVAIVGPTGSGKSALGLELARRFGAEILSCDSVAVYRGLDIGSAKPSASERSEVRHHLIDVADPNEQFTAARYVELANAAIARCRAQNGRLVLVGGSGLYFRSLLAGLSPLPSANPALRQALAAQPRAALHAELSQVDPASAARIDPNDGVRIIRALEVYRLTGRPISSFHAENEAKPPAYETLAIGLDPPKEVLHPQIAQRIENMFAAGFVEEVRALVERWGPFAPALASLGYVQVMEGILDTGPMPRRTTTGTGTPDGASVASASEAAVKASILQATWHFARRQRAWFRREKLPIIWYPTPLTGLPTPGQWPWPPPMMAVADAAERFWTGK